MTDDERRLLILVAGYVARLEGGTAEMAGGTTSKTADEIRALLAKIDQAVPAA